MIPIISLLAYYKMLLNIGGHSAITSLTISQSIIFLLLRQQMVDSFASFRLYFIANLPQESVIGTFSPSVMHRVIDPLGSMKLNWIQITLVEVLSYKSVITETLHLT